MKTVIYYLLQVIITSGLLYGYYHFVLRNNKFHRYNRFYLLAATVISIIVPFLNIPVYFTKQETASSFVLQTLSVISSPGNEAPVVHHIAHAESLLTWQNSIYLFYGLIALIALCRIIFSLYKIKKIIINNPVEKLNNIHFVNTAEPGTPFSFFRWLFWNRKIELGSEKGEQIFRHELFHIEQKHSRDIMYLELLTVVFWINPFFHNIKKELKAIHEFLADQFAVTGNKQWQYAELLLMQALNTNQQLVNPFFHNQIKRRIAMITISKKPSYQYVRKLMVLPVAAIVIGLFAFSFKQKKTDKNISLSTLTQNNADTTKPLSSNDKIFTKVEIEPSFPGGDLEWKKFVDKNLDISIPAKKNAPDRIYTTVIQFIVDKEGNISDFKPLTNHGFGMEEEAMRVIKKSPKWIPAFNGKNVNAYRRQPITFRVTKEQKNSSLNEMTAPINSSQSINDTIFTTAETPLSFPGGDSLWRKYLEKNADGLVPLKNGAPKGMYTVIAQFIVNIDGTISDLKTVTKHGFGMEQEVERLIANGPRWIPGMQNEKKVKAYIKQPVSFEVTVEPDKLKTDTEWRNTPNGRLQIPEISLSKLKKATPHQLLQLPVETEIVNYKFTIDLSNDDIVQINNKGKEFNTATRTQINNATPGRLITFDLITILKDGKEKKLPSKVYEITN